MFIAIHDGLLKKKNSKMSKLGPALKKSVI